MNRLIHALAALSLGAASLMAAAQVPDSVYEVLRAEAGTWDADITFYSGGKPTGTAKGVQVNTLLANGHWIVNEFKVAKTGDFPAYEGHGMWGYDPVAKTYVDTWIDTNDGAVRTSYGYWHEAEKTMAWSAKQPDGQGRFVDYRFNVEYKDKDTRLYTFWQLGLVRPTQFIRAQILFKRRLA
ncbi:DUF1579 family protein [Massilia endophytica]|uniref:DUF1579 family protein n=1 Tax=Massilia endophytica TaxID=2899220 RepID=UPI001E3E7B48|nr:DUF1579 family protein [Massilia endophytica]UGQ46369.1 DUF1579 domain-containing protein [Massilia endophytica]